MNDEKAHGIVNGHGDGQLTKSCLVTTCSSKTFVYTIEPQNFTVILNTKKIAKKDFSNVWQLYAYLQILCNLWPHSTFLFPK